MPAREFAYWQAYYRLEPWDGVRGDHHAALIASTIANVNRGKRRPYKHSDFLLQFGPQPTREESMLRKIEQLNRLFGGRDERGR